jgi:hypothetical protein
MAEQASWTDEARRSAEETWLTSNDPEDLLRGSLAGLEEDRGIRFQRKLRLFGVACLRRISHLFRDERSCRWIDVLEQNADGFISDEEQDRLGTTVVHPPNEDHHRGDDPEASRVGCAWQALCLASAHDLRPFDASGVAGWARDAAYPHPGPFGPADERRALHDKREAQAQVALLRDVLGNPFRPMSLSPSWRTPDVLALAQAAYDNRILPAGTLEPARLALLADALEDAGCTDPNILGHLRGPGVHVRGCWAVDLLLGKP